MGNVEKARVFKNGRSQAVRIPTQYRFESDEVFIRRNPITGEVTLSELPFAPTLEEVYAKLDAAGAADIALDRDLAPPVVRDPL
jgi:antitoxin VapB